ncbi:NAD(P)-dependent oxidoreductase [Nocardiopsis sp. MG754419]|uniref:NAD(P)-dependent oxidoreductase n=1 Tax=Nocardiopsis sp. MG754419 TaxID=2259865 RepID=UPI001BAB2656|nr:NAD(P)-dependent oxidoreductase [Nocardiopsis sp. MG754419]MBR8740762.1 NAD(P)-dependent oxidoreductase [Nocardiopsis sp. MG754419]
MNATQAPQSCPKSTVMFVGIGAIGLPMAEQIARAGHTVIGVDPSARQREAAAAVGVPARADVTGIDEADLVLVMVATPDQLHQAVSAPGAALDSMRPGAILAVMSTVGPEPVREAARRAAEVGVRLVDVPVTGGVAGARRAALTLFASGDPTAIADCSEVLSTMGTLRDCGAEPGRGQSYKVVNQLLCSVHIVAAAEALALAERLELDPAEVLDAVGGGAGASWMLGDRGPRMLPDAPEEITSTIGIFVKDSTLVTDTADAVGFSAPLAEAARAAYEKAAGSGLLDRDDSQVIQVYRD